MDNFDLKAYLSNNPLLTEEKLSSDEQNIVDDILSVSEGFNDIMDKIKSYAKKGVLTLAIISSVVSSLQAQGQTQIANQVEKAATELVSTPDPGFEVTTNPIIYKSTDGNIELTYKKDDNILGQYHLTVKDARYSNLNEVVGLYFKTKEQALEFLTTAQKISNTELGEGQSIVKNLEGNIINKIYLPSSNSNSSNVSVRRSMVRGGYGNLSPENIQQIIQSLQSFTP